MPGLIARLLPLVVLALLAWWALKKMEELDIEQGPVRDNWFLNKLWILRQYLNVQRLRRIFSIVLQLAGVILIFLLLVAYCSSPN
ncbi:MAG: hypothetical protein JXA78_18895 [Anaerolineales bacterium]|nr:hypothetical protein [Anaerolineales bacterium]